MVGVGHSTAMNSPQPRPVSSLVVSTPHCLPHFPLSRPVSSLISLIFHNGTVAYPPHSFVLTSPPLLVSYPPLSYTTFMPYDSLSLPLPPPCSLSSLVLASFHLVLSSLLDTLDTSYTPLSGLISPLMVTYHVTH